MTFFQEWSPEMAYVLGFIIADAAVTHTKRNTFFLSIQITDLALLRLIRSALQSDHTIHARESKNCNERTIYRLQLGSKALCGDLAKLGVVPRKSYVTRMPQVPDAYLGDFVRGYFDGDGNVWVGAVHKERRTQHQVISTAFTSCSRGFLESLKKYCNKRVLKAVLLAEGAIFGYRIAYAVRLRYMH